MALITLSISIVFSLIFLFFYLSNENKTILDYSFENNIYFESLFWNPILEAIGFSLVWFFLYIYLTWIFFKIKKEPENKKEEENKKNEFLSKYKKEVLFGFFILLVAFFLFYFAYTYLYKNIIFYLVFILSFFSGAIFFYLTKLERFRDKIILLRIISIILSYISIFLIIIYIIKYPLDIYIVLISLYLWLFNLFIHLKFENYISLIFWIITLIFLLYSLYYSYFYPIDDGIIFLCTTMFIALEFIILTYFYKFKYSFDYYFFYFISYLINFFWLIYFIYFFDIDLFNLSLIFFWEFLCIVLTYYKIKRLNT